MASPLRYRPIRTVLWGVYLFLALGFVALVVAAVMTGVLSERKLARDAPAGSSDPAACAQELGGLYARVHAELEKERTGATQDEKASAAGWAQLRTQLLALGARCPVKRGGADPLSKAFAQVSALQRLAESAAVQYRQEVAPTDAEAQKWLAAAGAKTAE